jgi:TLD
MISDKEKKYLLSLFGNKQFVTSFLYKASEHGFTAKEFHSRCDGKGPTITIIKVKDGPYISGFTNA